MLGDQRAGKLKLSNPQEIRRSWSIEVLQFFLFFYVAFYRGRRRLWFLLRSKVLVIVLVDTAVFQDEENDDFLSISRAMEEIVDDPVDCYWLIKCFVNQFHTKFGDSLPHLVSLQHSCA